MVYMSETDEPEVECDIHEIDQDPEKREEQAKTELVPRYQGYEEREDGFVFEFEADEGALQGVAEFVDQERVCCSFAEYHLIHSPPYEKVRLTVTGPEGTKEVFRSLVEGLETEEPLEVPGS